MRTPPFFIFYLKTKKRLTGFTPSFATFHLFLFSAGRPHYYNGILEINEIEM
jgi:hypothetical protein